MKQKILGLDLGESSVGSALVTVDGDEVRGIDHLGSRVFSSVVEAKTKTPLNRKRQAARSARRTIERRVRRRKKLENQLVAAGLLPDDTLQRDAILGRTGDGETRARFDPYILRGRAVTEALSAYELGRVFAHLGRRRGYQSNRKTALADLLREFPELQLDDTEEGEGADQVLEDEDGKVTLQQIADLKERMAESGAPTVGAYFARQQASGQKVRKERTARQMYRDEFEAIWAFQAPFHPTLLTPALKSDLVATFEQRPLKKPTGKRPRMTQSGSAETDEALSRLVKNCRKYPKRAVARNGHFVSQRFRILQSLKNLRLIKGNGEIVSPTSEQILELAVQLQEQQSMTWSSILTKLGGNKRTDSLNLQANTKEKGIKGNDTERFFKSILAEKWDNGLRLAPETESHQLELMQDIETATDALSLFKILTRPKANGNPLYPLTHSQAFEIAKRGFGRRTVAYSVRAMRKINQELLDGAANTWEALQALDESAPQNLQLDRLPEPPFVPNPRVRRCLNEVRKVVNAYIDRFGKPDQIRVELAREMRQTEKERKRIMENQREQQYANERARQFYRDHGRNEPSREDLLRHRLWIECGQHCPYTGDTISCEDLLAEGRVEVEHILPLDRSGDDGYRNKTLTFAGTNALKGNRTPIEWLGEHTQAYQDALIRFQNMRNPGKLKQFQTKEIPEDFVQRQLTETSYICTLAREYLQCLGIPVWVTNGRATAILRREWGLNGLIPIRETSKEIKKSGEKHRLDHRHHAVDALVTALTTPKAYRQALLHFHGDTKPTAPPAPQLRAAVKALVDQLLTSHDVDKGIKGALHDESFYGKVQLEGQNFYVRRVPIAFLAKASLKDAEEALGSVYDPELRKNLRQHLRAYGDPKAAFGHEEVRVFDGQGKPMIVQTIRIRHGLTDKATIYLGHGRYVKPNSNHHAEIVRDAKGRYSCRPVTMIEAARAIRKSRRSPIGLTVQEGETLVHALSINEVVEYQGVPLRVTGASLGELVLRDLNDARGGSELGRIRLKGSDRFSEIGTKLILTLLGELTKDRES